uniref:Reverse transcriptase domain-containing protein n=1 Tax=Tanacetum cinerariifolium TaxID=118510 RepID=A0A6L2L0X6_TANCI|nr:reverse transcriptase domain-containing protein [Tanacetum cinerariifolium]
MRDKDNASWDRAQGHMRRSRESFGTVQVVSRCTGVAVGKGVFLAGMEELALLCPTMVETKHKKIEAYICGLSENIKGDVTLSKPAKINEAVCMAHALIEKRVQARAERIVEGNKRNTLIDINLVRLNTSYEVELADGKIVSTNTVLKGCTINLVNHLFEIDLMPIKLRTFDVIIGIDWLSEYDAVIVCGNKVVRIPHGNKTLRVEVDRGKSRLKVISCIKARKYIERGCQLYLAQVTKKETASKRLKDVSVIHDSPKVLLDDLPGLPPPRKSKAEHWEHLKITLELLKKEKLYAKFSKYDFWLESVQFLGHLINSEGVHVDPTKIEAIKNWVAPKTQT